MRALLPLIASLACASNPGVARYVDSAPAPLPSVGPSRAAESVQVAMKSLPWWTLVGEGGGGEFVLQLGADDTVPAGRRIGPVRTRDVALSRSVFEAVRCAWEMVSLGEARRCGDLQRSEAIALGRGALAEAHAELRAQAADAGAVAVADVRCFARRAPLHPRAARPEVAVLWCEGTAVTPEPTVAATTPAVEPDLDAALEREPAIAETRLVFAADGSVGVLGAKPVVATTLSLRYRPFELGFTIVDLERETLEPQAGGLVGLGATVLGRIRLGRSRVDALVGATVLAVAPNGSVNPDFDALYQGFLGLAYQTPWKLAGAAQPFVQLRAGATSGTAIASKTLPMLELHLGLSSPERR